MSDKKLWDQYVALEKERDELRAELEKERKEHSYTLHAAEAEAKQVDRLRAKIESMERQETVAEVGQVYMLNWCGFDSIANIVKRHNLKVGDKLFATTGAQPAPSALDALLRSRVADLLHLLQFAQIACPTTGDSEQAESVMADIRRMLEQGAKS